MGRGGVLLLAALVFATASPAAAEGIVFECGDGYANLCRIQPNGSGQVSLTTDGGREGSVYASPSLSRDASRLAFNYANRTFVVDDDPTRRSAAVAEGAAVVKLRPDAGWLATTEMFPAQTLVPGPTGPTFFSTLVPFIVTYNLTTSERRMTRRLPGAVAWAGERLVSSGQPTSTKKQTLCVLNPENVNCERQVAQDDRRDLTDPSVSPDNKLLAVAVCARADRQACGLAVYEMATGARALELTTGSGDTSPAWSPDGTRIVFARSGDLYVVAAGGGGERLLVRGGRSPTWGGTASSQVAPVPPAPAPPEPVLSAPSPSELDPVQLALDTAADHIQVPVEQLVVLTVEPIDWSDSSLGCPEPDRAYSQVITPGFLVVVATDDGSTELHIHTDQGPARCRLLIDIDVGSRDQRTSRLARR
jgi:dipeptidyl aminopeptidase/acylaminoacyl peptidase